MCFWPAPAPGWFSPSLTGVHRFILSYKREAGSTEVQTRSSMRCVQVSIQRDARETREKEEVESCGPETRIRGSGVAEANLSRGKAGSGGNWGGDGERRQGTGGSAREMEGRGRNRRVTMPPSTSSWSSVRSSTTLGLREPAATPGTPRQLPSSSSSSAGLQEGR